MARNRTGHARRRSHVATGLMAVVGTGVVIGLGLGYSERPVGLCVLAIAGLIVVLLCLTVLRTPLALLFSTLAGRHGAHFVQGPIVRVGLWVLLLLVSLVAVLWPATLPWTLFAALALLGAIASVELLRLHPDMGVRKVPLDKAAGPRWAWRGLLGLSAAWFMELVPGQAMHAVGGPVAEPPSAALASAFGDLEHRIMARFDRQDEMLAEQGEKLDRALALLEERESEVRRLPAGDDAPPGPPPLSPQDRAILDAAKPFANALTRYRIAVAEGDDALAGELEEEVLAQRDTKRADEDFLFERARGDRHFNAGRFDQAIPAYRAALAVREGDPAVLNNLAVALLRGRGNTDHGAALHEAESLLARSLDIRRHMHEGDHADVTLSLNNLAAVRQALGRAGEAEPLYEQALAMRRRLFEGDHPDVALSLNNLAFVRQALGRGGEAEPLYEQALAIQLRLFEGDHPDVAMSINNLAGVREAMGRAVEAEPLCEEDLDMRRRLIEGDDPDVASSLNNLASVRESLGRAGEAEPLYAEALAMYRRLFEGDH
ncbi:MAG: tetratricopeptide repeat protein, partial [Phycisphaerales bacterium]